ncbi:unnamed protein product [Orchesella dallaii]|uniref:Uncharacterized protein n=1 Tax=Orchesella dallaii TaxID=48710 RepID=A0ABP1RSD7_9HEXA
MATLSELYLDCKLAVKTHLKAGSAKEKLKNSSKGNLLLNLFIGVGVLFTTTVFLYVFLVLRFEDFVISSIEDAFGNEGILGFYTFSRFLSTSLSLYKLQIFRGNFYYYCFLMNPVVELSNPPCHLCKDIYRVLDLNGVSNTSTDLYSKKVPFIVKNAFPTPIKFHTLEEILAKNFGFEKLPSEANSHMELDTTRYNLSRALRDIIPNPTKHIPKITWLDIHQKLLIDGQSSPSYPLLPPELEIVYAMQLHGHRTIQLLPKRNCRATCTTISIDLEPGDIFYYNVFLWNAISKPVDDKGTTTDLSIIRTGSFVT